MSLAAILQPFDSPLGPGPVPLVLGPSPALMAWRSDAADNGQDDGTEKGPEIGPEAELAGTSVGDAVQALNALSQCEAVPGQQPVLASVSAGSNGFPWGSLESSSLNLSDIELKIPELVSLYAASAELGAADLGQAGWPQLGIAHNQAGAPSPKQAQTDIGASVPLARARVDGDSAAVDRLRQVNAVAVTGDMHTMQASAASPSGLRGACGDDQARAGGGAPCDKALRHIESMTPAASSLATSSSALGEGVQVLPGVLAGEGSAICQTYGTLPLDSVVLSGGAACLSAAPAALDGWVDIKDASLLRPSFLPTFDSA